MLKISPYSSINFASKKQYNTSEEGQKFYFENAKAYTANGEPFSGRFKHQDDSKNEYILLYKDGDLKASSKNHKLYKKYSYKTPSCSFLDSNFATLNDGSKITFEDLAAYRPNITRVKTVQNLEDNSEHTIFINDDAFDGEAKFAHFSLDKNSNEIKSFCVNKNNELEFNFSSLEEAKEYFFNKYGIKANFKDLSQAVLLKQAVDAFVPLNYQGKGERLFEGLEVQTAKLNKGAFAIVQQHFSCVDKNDEKRIKEYGINPGSNETVDFMGKYLTMEGQTLYFNSAADINNKKIYTKYITGYHPVYLQKGYLIHELAHWLHYNNSAADAFWLNEKDPSNEEQEIIKQVSGYAQRNFDEFIAEYVAGKLDGIEYSKEVDKLYKNISAPELF